MLGSVEKNAPEYGYFLNASKTKPSIKRGLCRACFLWKSITILAEGRSFWHARLAPKNH